MKLREIVAWLICATLIAVFAPIYSPSGNRITFDRYLGCSLLTPEIHFGYYYERWQLAEMQLTSLMERSKKNAKPYCLNFMGYPKDLSGHYCMVYKGAYKWDKKLPIPRAR